MVPKFPMGRHAMRVGDRWDGNNPDWKMRTTFDIAWRRWDDAGVNVGRLVKHWWRR